METKYFLLLLAVIVFAVKPVYAAELAADTTYVFSYDNSGNRTQRVIDFSKSAQLANNASATDETQIIEDDIASYKIKIYPNPTKGLLMVEAPGLTDGTGRLIIYNLQGGILIDRQVSNTMSEINLSNFSSGMYILRLNIGQEVSEWKIIKD